MLNEKLNRINELARIAKRRELTPEETLERAALRAEYVAEWRSATEQTLENIYIADEAGNKTKLRKKK